MFLPGGFRKLSILLFISGLITGMSDIGIASALDDDIPAGSDWRYYNKTLDGQRYSPLDQINVKNAASLQEVCRIRVSDDGPFQAGLIVVDGTLYATQANDTIALNAANCVVKWRHSYHRSQAALAPMNRGVTYASGRLFRGTDDGRLICLDAGTGTELWADVIGDPGVGEYITSAPVAVNGLVITGTVASEFGIRGRVVAVDALSGREVWHFYTIPIGRETGADTWLHTNWNLHGGGGTWSTFTVDASTNEVFAPVGNAVPDFSPDDRPGRNLFSNSVVALDLLTGKLKWWYQTKPHDAQDHDLGAAPVLYRDGHGQDRVAAAGKDGYLHIIDRQAHTRIIKVAVTTVDGVQKKPSISGVVMCPGSTGGVEWNGPAFDPINQSLFVGAVDFCSIFKSSPGSGYAPGALNYGGTWTPTLDVPTGWITAIDAGTGKIKWRYHAESPVVSGITPTAGGVVLAGDNAGNFLILNSVTGELLTKIATEGSLSGGVITYLQEGRQFVAFTSGNVSRSVFGAVGRPTIIVMALPPTLPSSVAGGAKVPDANRGREVFYSMCAGCHGIDGKNIVYDGGDLTTINKRMSQEQIIAWVRNPKPPMPKVFPDLLEQKEEDDLNDVATFLAEWLH